MRHTYSKQPSNITVSVEEDIGCLLPVTLYYNHNVCLWYSMSYGIVRATLCLILDLLHSIRCVVSKCCVFRGVLEARTWHIKFPPGSPQWPWLTITLASQVSCIPCEFPHCLLFYGGAPDVKMRMRNEDLPQSRIGINFNAKRSTTDAPGGRKHKVFIISCSVLVALRRAIRIIRCPVFACARSAPTRKNDFKKPGLDYNYYLKK